MIRILGSDVITKLGIWNQEPADPKEPHPLLIFYGEANGSLNIFDFRSKRKHETDTLMRKISRNINGEEQHHIEQIVVAGQYVFCLVRRWVIHKSWIKRFR